MVKTARESIQDYLSHCTYEKNLNPLSIKAYRQDLAQFCAFFGHGRDILEIDKDIVRQFVRGLFDLRLKATSIKRKMASLKAFLRYLELEDCIPVSPFRKLNIHIRTPKRIPSYFSMHDIQNLFAAGKEELSRFPETDGLSRRAYVKLQRVAILEILFSTGVRVSELCALDINDVDLSKRSVKVYGKGSRERTIILTHPKLIDLLDAFKKQRTSIKTDSSALLVNRSGRRMQPHSIRAILRELSSRARMKVRARPHMFRHTIATLLIENGLDTHFVQKFLGHSSIVTTQIYTHPSTLAERQLLSSKHPRNML